MRHTRIHYIDGGHPNIKTKLWGAKMKKSFYERQRPCYIYLLVLDVEDEEPYYFVGKSFAFAISKVYSRHIHGGYATTKNIFSKTEKPRLYVLKNCNMTEAEAYRHIVAYVKYFEEHNLGECLNHDGTTWQTGNLMQDTERIYNEITRESLEDLLQHSYVSRAVDADRKKTSDTKLISMPAVQLNIAVDQHDKGVFQAYCKHFGLSQREAFSMLLNKDNSGTTENYERVIEAKNKKIINLEKEIVQLQRKLALASGDVLPRKELWAREMFPFLLAGVNQYIQIQLPRKEAMHPIKSRPYKSMLQNGDQEEYSFPEKEGFYLIKLQTILWGNNKSCFYAGVGVDGNRYRFRYYKKDWFAGIVPRGSGYEEYQSLWLVGCKQSTDGAMDIVAAFPVLVQKQHDSIDGTACVAAYHKIALADKLAEIERRNSV